MGCIRTVKVKCAEWWWGVYIPLRLDVLSVAGCIRTVKVKCAEWWWGVFVPLRLYVLSGGGVYSYR